MSNHRVIHFEIPCNDPEKTMAFFAEVFGWKFQQFGTEQYWSVTTGDDNQPGINGGIMKKKDPQQPLTNSIGTDDLDATLEKILKSGGKIALPKMPIHGVGWLAYFFDPDGNIHGLHQSDPSARFEG